MDVSERERRWMPAAMQRLGRSSKQGDGRKKKGKQRRGREGAEDGGLRICETSKLQTEYDGLGAGVQGDGRRRAQTSRQWQIGSE